MRAFVIIALVLSGCSPTAQHTNTPALTRDRPEPTQSLDDRIASYVETYGGTESQYEVILTLDDCDNLGNLLESATTSMENEPEGSDEWRADLGYANAVNERQLEIDC